MKFKYILPFFLVICQVVAYDVNVLYGDTIMEAEIDFEAAGTFNVNGFSFCGCPRFRPTLPSPQRNPLINLDTHEIDLNSIIKCLTSFAPDQCRSDEFPQLTVNLIEGKFEDVSGICISGGEECANDRDSDDSGSDMQPSNPETPQNLTLNFFVDRLCDSSLFRNVLTVNHNGEAEPGLIGDIVTVYSSHPVLAVAAQIIGDPFGILSDGINSGLALSFVASEAGGANAWLESLEFQPNESAEVERSTTLRVSVTIDGKQNNVAATQEFQIVIGAVSRNLVIDSPTTLSESQTVDSLTCSAEGSLTLETGVTLTVEDSAIVDCVISGPGTLEIAASTLTCGSTAGQTGTISNTGGVSVSVELVVQGTCTLTSTITCSGNCQLTVSGGTVNVNNPTALPQNIAVVLTEGATYNVNAAHSLSGEFRCESGTIGLSSGGSLTVLPGGTIVLGLLPTTTPNQRCRLTRTASSTNSVIVQGNARIRNLRGENSLWSVEGVWSISPGGTDTCETDPCRITVSPTGRYEVLPAPDEGMASITTKKTRKGKGRKQQVNSTVMSGQFVEVSNGGSIDVGDNNYLDQQGGCTVDGTLNIGQGSTFDVSNNNGCTMTENASGTGSGSVSLSAGSLRIDAPAVPFTVNTEPGTTLNIGANGPTNLPGGVNSNGQLNVGPADLTTPAVNMGTDPINFVFGPNEFGQIVGDLNGSNSGTTPTGFSGENNFTGTEGETLIFVLGNTSGNLADAELNLPNFEPQMVSFTGDTSAQTQPLTAVSSANPNDNNNQGTGGTGGTGTPTTTTGTNSPGTTNTASTGTTTTGGGGDGGGGGGIGIAIGAAAGGVVLLLLCVVGGVLIWRHQRVGDGSGGPEHFKDTGYGLSPSSPAGIVPSAPTTPLSGGYGQGGYAAPASTPVTEGMASV